MFYFFARKISDNYNTIQGSCWLRQWKLPKPQIISVESIPITLLFEKQDWIICKAISSLVQLKALRLLNGKQLNIVELPMPSPVVYNDQRLPASYANFYICNKFVIDD